jgi:BMFP domain-containing protein YqiC
MENQIDRIKEIMGIKIISENIAPVVANEFRNFIEHIISSYSAFVTRADIDRLLKNTTRKEIKNLSKDEVEELLKKIDYESLVRTLLNKQLVSTNVKRGFFDRYINEIIRTRMTVEQTIDAVKNNKIFSHLYNASKNVNPNEPVPDFVQKMEKEMNEIWLDEYEVELKRRSISVPPRIPPPIVDDLANIFADRDKLIKFINKEAKSAVGKEIPIEQIEAFADKLLEVVNNSVKKFQPKFELLFKDLESYLSKLNSKQREEFYKKAYNNFLKTLSENTEIPDTIKQKLINFLKSGMGIPKFMSELKNKNPKEMWNTYVKSVKISLTLATAGSVASFLRSENPITNQGGFMKWGWKKYFLTITPVVNVIWAVSYAAIQTVSTLISGPELFKDDSEELSGPTDKKVTRRDAKEFVENRNGLLQFLPPGTSMVNLDITYKQNGNDVVVFINGNNTATLTKRFGYRGYEVKVK